MTEDHSEYLASGSGEKPADHERLDMIRAILADEATWSEPPQEVGQSPPAQSPAIALSPAGAGGPDYWPGWPPLQLSSSL